MIYFILTLDWQTLPSLKVQFFPTPVSFTACKTKNRTLLSLFTHYLAVGRAVSQGSTPLAHYQAMGYLQPGNASGRQAHTCITQFAQAVGLCMCTYMHTSTWAACTYARMYSCYLCTPVPLSHPQPSHQAAKVVDHCCILSDLTIPW